MNINTNGSINHVAKTITKIWLNTKYDLNTKQSKYYSLCSSFTDFNEFETQSWTKLFAYSIKIF